MTKRILLLLTIVTIAFGQWNYDYSKTPMQAKIWGNVAVSDTVPSYHFYDAQALDGDLNAQILVNADSIVSGDEDVDFSIYQQVEGTLSRTYFSDADQGIWLYPLGESANPVSITTGGDLNLPNNLLFDTASEIQWNATDKLIHTANKMTLAGFTTWDFGAVATLDFDGDVTIKTAANANQLFLDSATGRVAIGSSTAASILNDLNVDGTFAVGSATEGVRITTSAGYGSIMGLDMAHTGYNALDIRAQSGQQLYLNTDGSIDMSGAVDVDGALTAGTIASDGAMQVGTTLGIGIAPSADNGLTLGGTITSGGVSKRGMLIYPTFTLGTGGDGNAIQTSPAITEFSSGTHNVIAGLQMNAFTVVNGGGTEVVTNLANLYIAGAPTAGTTPTNGPYAIQVASGNSYFGGDATFSADVSVGGFLNVGGAVSLGVVSGGVVATSSYIVVTAEAAATDVLSSIAGGAEGDQIFVSKEGAESVIIRNTTGANGVLTAGDADFTMDNVDDRWHGLHNGTEWVELSRSSN